MKNTRIAARKLVIYVVLLALTSPALAADHQKAKPDEASNKARENLAYSIGV
jgi:hypothetical protein